MEGQDLSNHRWTCDDTHCTVTGTNATVTKDDEDPEVTSDPVHLQIPQPTVGRY